MSTADALARTDAAPVAAALRDAAQTGFFDGLATGCLVAGAVAAVGAVLTALLLPPRPSHPVAAASPTWGSAVGSGG